MIFCSHRFLFQPLPKKLPNPSNAELLTKQIRSLAETVSPPLLLWSLALTGRFMLRFWNKNSETALSFHLF